jgi:hypothetical protein
MKWARRIFVTLLAAGALLLFGRFYLSQMEPGNARRGDQLAGVLLSPPPGYSVIERGELLPATAAQELEARASQPGASKVGLHFRRQGAEVYWLADAQAGILEERSAGAGGTRLQTVWKGGLQERLTWAKEHGTFDVPGLPSGERVNLYH